MKKDVAEEVKDLKESLSTSMTELKSLSRRHGLAAPGTVFGAAEKALVKEDFTIVVFGEQKNGKSSFVNALLGKSLLPVGVEVTTNQAFRISHAETESFFLVFSDGIREEITKEDMVRYGKEGEAQLANAPLLRGRELLWIEVNTPAAFLPPGVHLLDTPGLGALFPEHAKVTNRCLGAANAAIFIKDVTCPIKESELGFVKSAFSITKNIMFVLNKVDTVDPDVRNSILARNAELLNKEFRDVAGRDIKMWPFSSTLLLKAASESNPEYQAEDREDAGYTALFGAIRALIDKTVGFAGGYFACQESIAYYKTLDGAIAEQIQMLGTTDAKERSKLMQAKSQRQAEFLKEWGPNGAQVRSLNNKVNDVLRQGERMMQSMFVPLQQSISKEIDSYSDDLDSLRSYADRLPGIISSRVEMRWNEIVNDVLSNLRNLQSQLAASGGEVSVEGLLDSVNLTEVGGFREKVSGGMLGFGAGSVVANIGGAVLLGVVGTVALPVLPLLVAAPFVGGLIGLLTGKKAAEQKQAAAYKQSMKKFLQESISQCQQNLLFQSSIEQKSPASLFFDGIRRQVSDSCSAMVEEEKSRMEAELADLEAKAQMNVEEAKNRIAELNAAKAKLTEIKASLSDSRSRLLALAAMLKF